MRYRRFVVLLLVWCVPLLAWGQGAQLINGNRVQAGWVNFGVTSGSGTAYTLTFTPALPGYVFGSCYLLGVHTPNTGPATLNINGLGAKNLLKWSGGVLAVLAANDLRLGKLLQACYDGTQMQLLSLAEPGVGGGGVTDGDKGDISIVAGVWTIDPGTVTYAKIQPVSTSQRVLGRISAGAGPIEELSVATIKAMLGLTFGDLTGVATDAQIPDLNTLGTGLGISRCVETDVTGKLGVAAGPCGVSGGSTGITGATNHGLMVATGGTTGSSLPVATNGQIPIGVTGADPILGTLSGTSGQIQITPGPGSIGIAIPTNPTLPGTTTGAFNGSFTGSLAGGTGLPLTSGVTGALPYTNLVPATGPSQLLGRGAAGGAGPWQEVTLGTNLSMAGTTLNATTTSPLTPGPGLAASVNTWRTDSTEAQFLNPGATDLVGGAGQMGKMQVMPDGTLQYTDNAATPALRKGFLTQPGISWQVIPGNCTADPNSGKLTVNGANQIICAPDQGGGGAPGGDISAVGTCGTGECGTAASPLQGMFYSASAAPATPAAGGALWFDITAQNFAVLTAAGTVKHAVQTKTATASQWLNSIADNGVVTSTQPASADLSDGATLARLTTAQKLTQTRVQPRMPATVTSSPVDINTDTTDQVQGQFTTAVTFNVPTGTPDNGQALTIAIYSAAAQALTWTQTTSGFAAENGRTLPSSSFAGTYLVLEFRWNALSLRWGLVWSSREDYKAVALTDAATVVGPVGGIIDCDSMLLGYLNALSQPSLIPNPTCTPQNGQSLTYRIISASPQPLSWGNQHAGSAGIPLPTTTTGGGTTDLFGFRRNNNLAKWELVATTQNAATALLKACVIALGDQVAAVPLTNAQLGPRIRQCPGLGRSGVVKEIGVYADKGTPSVIVHRQSGISAALDLVSGALATGAGGTGGTYACARIAGDTLSQNGATTCAATLINTSWTGEVSFGLTSGVAGGQATEMNIVIFYTPTS